METKESPTLEGLTVVLPPHFAERFEKADRQMMEIYGISPGVPSLVRMWIACATPSRMRKEFAGAVLQITKPNFSSEEEHYLDENTQ